MQVVVPKVPTRGKISDQEIVALAWHDCREPLVLVCWRRRDPLDDALAAGEGLVDKVLEGGSDGEAEEGEVIGGGDDAGLRGAKLLYADSGKVDAEVRDGRRVSEAEGHLEFVARARRGLHGGGVVAVGEVGCAVEENPEGVAGGVGAGGIGGRGVEGAGHHQRSRHGWLDPRRIWELEIGRAHV